MKNLREEIEEISIQLSKRIAQLNKNTEEYREAKEISYAIISDSKARQLQVVLNKINMALSSTT